MFTGIYLRMCQFPYSYLKMWKLCKAVSLLHFYTKIELPSLQMSLNGIGRIMATATNGRTLDFEMHLNELSELN
jgi:hypothetical protein